jgi:hypothetical protein
MVLYTIYRRDIYEQLEADNERTFSFCFFALQLCFSCSFFLHREAAWILHSIFADFGKIRRAMKKLADSGNIGALQNRQV